jgi:hypothetical protein
MALEEKYPKTKEAKKKPPPARPHINVIFCAGLNPPNVLIMEYSIRESASNSPVNPNICTGLSSNVFFTSNPNLFTSNVLFIMVY